MVVALEERGWLFVNQTFIASFDLSDVKVSGDVAVITGTATQAVKGPERPRNTRTSGAMTFASTVRPNCWDH